MYKKILALNLIIILILSIFTGCGKKSLKPEGRHDQSSSQQVTGIEEKGEKKIKIGFASLDESTDFHISIKKSVIENSKKSGVDVITVDNQGDPATALRNVDYLIMQGIDVLVEYNTDVATNRVIKDKCDSAGIPVLGVDIPVPESPTMGADNVKSGRLVGRTLGKLAKKNWNGEVDYLLLVDLPRSGEEIKTRMDNVVLGVREIIKDLPDSKIIRVDGKYDMNVSMHLTSDFLAAHPDAHHILIGTYSDAEAFGVLSAIKRADRHNDCFIVNHGVSTPTIVNLKSKEDNCWKAGVAHFPEKYGDYIVPAAIKLVKGEKVSNYIPMKHVVITKDNINEYYPD